jgi:tRNA pseudouridine55 synthase
MTNFLSTIDRGSEGILLVDKPSGITSHDVVKWARRVTGIKRIGHTGTLDPLASGLLILLIGRSFTKLQAQYLKADKEYLCQGKLGFVSDTYDCTGEVSKSAEWKQLQAIGQDKVEDVLNKFRGQISQVVPAYSAVKVGGRKLYEKARRGEVSEAELPSRQVMINELELTEWLNDTSSQEVTISLRVKCSSGTYIRSLIHDLGQELGAGAIVTELRRTQIGDLSIKQAGLCLLSN